MHDRSCASGGNRTAIRLVCVVAAGTALIASRPAAAILAGPNSPAAVVDDASFGGAGWFPAANASASDNAYAQATPAGSPTHYLKATSFGFAIPAPAQILGIEVLVERRSSVGSVFDARARIVKGGVVGTADRALGGTWPTTDTIVTYGSPSDLWGETWAPADINNVGFGFALSVDDGVDTAAVDHIQIRVTYSLCASTPAGGCRTALKSVLVIKDNTNDTKDKLTWKWIKGQSTTQAEFGDPAMGSANIALCVYDNTGLLGDTLTAPGANWSVVTTKGFKFLDKTGAQDGVQKIVLTGNTSNKAKALVKGKGANLPDIAPALTLPVTVQLVNSQSGLCWEGVFTSAIKNQTGLFKAKAQ